VRFKRIPFLQKAFYFTALGAVWVLLSKNKKAFTIKIQN